MSSAKPPVPETLLEKQCAATAAGMEVAAKASCSTQNRAGYIAVAAAPRVI